MTSPGRFEGGRVVARAVCRLLFVAGAVGCQRTGGVAESPDAAVTFRSAATTVTRPATWQNLWGSWPLQRYDHPASYDSDRKVMVIFGGRGSTNGPYYKDTWEWDGARGAWNERTPASANSPADRSGHVMAYDPVRKKTFLFSGWQPAAGFYIPEQWEWDGPTASWSQIDATSATVPSARYGATMAWDPDRQRMVLFGGFDETTGRRNDLWEWDGTTKTWTDRTPTGTKPTPRWSHTMAYDPVRKKMVVYSGNTGTGTASSGSFVDETWEWDGATATWTKMATPSSTVVYYYYGYLRMVYDVSRSKMEMFYDYTRVYEYDPTMPAWTQVANPTRNDQSNYPGQNGSAIYDPDLKVMTVFGGNNRTLWDYSGADATFTNRSTPVNGPIQRNSPAIAFDTKQGKLMLFGGYSSLDSLYKQDTWEWSGSSAVWTNRTNANTKPEARYQAAMVYDSKRDQLLLWGGSGTGVTNDMWSWSSTTKNWTALTVSGVRPNVTYGHQMFYDPARDKVVVWVNYYTIWEFDPATNTWTSRLSNTPNIPTGFQQRGYYELAYDTDRSKLMFIGGYGYVTNVGNVYDADVWEWDAATGVFTERPPAAGAAAPVGRNQHGVSYDPSRRTVVLFGGYAQVTAVATGPQNDSWEFDCITGAWTETTPPGVKPLARYNHLQIYDPARNTTVVFGGQVNDDTTYGPQEIWEYIANTQPRPNGSGCSPASASSCASGNCVDGVCCAQTAAQCAGTCKACNVAGSLGTCSNVPAGQGDDTCPSDQACDPNQQCKAIVGHACGSFADCASGHCADGVCCNTDCNDTCKACNLTGTSGTCTVIPTGIEDPGTCSSDANQPRFCDGSGVCTNGAKPNGKPCTAAGQCTSTFCVDGTCCSSNCANTCYSCGLPGTLGSCYPIPAGQPDHSATTTCDGTSQYCTGSGTCGMNKKVNGLPCGAASECGSGYCVDGTCCNSSCTGLCQACNVPGSLGSCVNVPAGTQDPNSTPSTCVGSQYCDGSGVCQSGLKANGTTCAMDTECGSAHCADGVCCDSGCTGTCTACNLPGSKGSCVSVGAGMTDPNGSPACTSPNYCNADRSCTSGKRANGSACGSASECASGNCVDKVCCDSACAGTCQTCSTGTCGLVPAGMDPRGNCKGTLAACGGTCDGQGACAFAPQGKSCRTTGCQPDLGLITNSGTCDGAGNCPVDPTTDCHGFGCFTDSNGAAMCKTDCSTDPDCAIRRYCDVVAADAGAPDGGGPSSCPSQFALGHACTRNPQCLSGTCAIPTGGTVGTCCNTDCSKCGSCDATGTCVPFAAGTDPNGDCMDSASDPTHVCGGKCDGHAHCAYPAAGVTCGTCKSCNGSGLCNTKPDDDSACGTIDCDTLDTSCLDYHDLTTHRCAALGSCKAANTAATCTDVTSSCGVDGGAGGSSGSAGSGGSVGSGGSTGKGGSTGGAGHKAGSSGSDTDGGTVKSGGGGGCGCDLGGPTPAGFGSMLLGLAGILARRRRR
jgi:hypothetical protein